MSADHPDRSDPTWALVLSVVVCAVVMLGPLFLFKDTWVRYQLLHGGIREGAAATGAGVAFAFAAALRTVSRSVLRALTRTTARAGFKVTLKSAVRSAARAGGRGLLGSIATAVSGQAEDPDDASHSNLRSLLVASLLLYVSWLIVVGVGQPFAGLMDRQDTLAAEHLAVEALLKEQEELTELLDTEGKAWTAQERVREARRELVALRRSGAPIVEAEADLSLANAAFAEALARSGARIAEPHSIPRPELDAEPGFLARIYTYAPYPGPTPWSSNLLWLGGLLMILPLWVIFGVQTAAARRLSVPIFHSTSADGGVLQLYFAGALSFMPLTSDVYVGGSRAQRGWVATVGLLVPTLIGVALWLAWRLLGESPPALLLAADAFLLYPMVQVFPLHPLDGYDLWGWKPGVWAAECLIIAAAFVLVGSEGLKHVI